MTRALVVFESMFGNTQQIAEAVKEGLSTSVPTDILEVGTAPGVIPDGVGLIIVGGPTHAFGMSRPKTREDATRQAGGHVVSGENGLRGWITGLERAHGRDLAAAASDTRIAEPRVPGSAARRAEKRVGKLGFKIATPSESFYVTGTAGPLVDGETERARRWGEELGKGFKGDPEAAVDSGGRPRASRPGDSSAIDVPPISRGEETA